MDHRALLCGSLSGNSGNSWRRRLPPPNRQRGAFSAKGGVSWSPRSRALPRVRSAKHGRARTDSDGIMSHPLAYHLIWTTYGSWLPGDARGWIKAGVWGVQSPDPKREQQARAMMAEEAVVLNRTQRDAMEQTIRDHCRVRQWVLHAVN